MRLTAHTHSTTSSDVLSTSVIRLSALTLTHSHVCFFTWIVHHTHFTFSSILHQLFKLSSWKESSLVLVYTHYSFMLPLLVLISASQLTRLHHSTESLSMRHRMRPVSAAAVGCSHPQASHGAAAAHTLSTRSPWYTLPLQISSSRPLLSA